MKYRHRRLIAALIIVLLSLGGAAWDTLLNKPEPVIPPSVASSQTEGQSRLAGQVLEELAVKGRAPKTGYSRTQFGGWQMVGACDVRNHILKRDMTEVVVRTDSDCTVISGTLDDPYTGKIIKFVRGPDSSGNVQIDHIVSLSDAWQKGAQALTANQRLAFANDPLNLLAVEGVANQAKGDGDAATWLPPNKDYRCRFIARQIAVKSKYQLWVTAAERDAMRRVLHTCPDQLLPTTSPPHV